VVNAGFRVDPDALDGLAARAEVMAGRLRAEAGAGPPLDLAAYGLLGRIFAVAALGAADARAAAVADLAGRADAHAGHLRAAAAGYRRAERQIAAGLGGGA
jgi:hypothetical protein